MKELTHVSLFTGIGGIDIAVEAAIHRAYQAGHGEIPHQPGMGGMADGLPMWMDGHRIWGREPDGTSRVMEREADWGKRMASLGNAVVPQQAYPILKCIADLETGRCRGKCVAARKI